MKLSTRQNYGKIWLGVTKLLERGNNVEWNFQPGKLSEKGSKAEWNFQEREIKWNEISEKKSGIKLSDSGN